METEQGNQQSQESFGVSDQVDPSSEGQDFQAQTDEGQEEQQAQDGQEDGQEDVYVPFKDGKEKFTIDGQEVEMDWEETKKSVQLAQSSYKRFEDAKKIEKTAQTVLEQIKQKARENPEGLIKIFNPNWQGGNSQAQSQETAQGGQRMQDQDNPWQSKFEELQRQNEELRQRFEEQDVQAERAKLQQEFTEVQSKYPVFQGKAEMAFLKSEYAKALRNGMEVDLEDVAFTISQDLKNSQVQRIQSQNQKRKQARERAPVSSQPGAGGAKKEFEDFEDVKKSLGMI